MTLPPETEYPEEILFKLTMRAKTAMRGRLKALRAATPADAIATRSASIVERVKELAIYQSAKTIAMFVAMPQEVHLATLAEHARAQGKHVALPIVMQSEPSIVFRSWMHNEQVFALQKSSWGLQEPTETAPHVAYEDIDLVIVPALGVGENGHRIGYGKGHYDRVLPRCTRAKSVVVAFDFQLLAEIPVFESDRACDVVVTDRQTIIVSSTT